MKHQRFTQLIISGLVFSFAASCLHAATFTWSGGGANDNWNTGANWGGTAPGATGQTLIFSGTTRLNSNNNSVTSTAGITFAADAGAFTIGGNNLGTVSSITNLSASTQTITNLTSGNMSVTTSAGDVALSTSTLTGNDYTSLNKFGTGTLTLANPVTFTSGIQGGLVIEDGTLHLDVNSGFSAPNTVPFVLKFIAPNTGVAALAQVSGNSVLAITGNAAGTTNLALRSLSLNYAANSRLQILLDAPGVVGTTLSFASMATYYGTATATLNTVNIDLSSSATNHFKILQAGTLGNAVNGIIPGFTVTTTENVGGFDVKRTGLAGVTGSAGAWELVRNVPVATLAASGNSSTVNYSTSGSLTYTGNASANSLTITGAGTVSGTGSLASQAVLMQEGSGDYTMNVAAIGNATNFFIHQYSTSGSLIINGNLQNAESVVNPYSTNNKFAKSGAGTVILNGNARGMISGADIQQGEFVLNGSMASAGSVIVHDEATLSGAGSIGGGLISVGGAIVYTPVRVFQGGTLDATYDTAKALTITGSLILDPGSNFKVDLYDSPFASLTVNNDPTVFAPVVTLNGNLELTLNYAPTPAETITLINSANSFTGAFATVNGQAFRPGSTFGLGAYQFEVNYGPTSVYLTTLAVPEPSTALLLAFGGLTMFITRRRAHV